MRKGMHIRGYENATTNEIAKRATEISGDAWYDSSRSEFTACPKVSKPAWPMRQ